MGAPEHDEGRPLAGPASNVIADDLASIIRCRRCQTPLSAPVSVDLGIGPKCRHREAGEAA